MQPLQIERQTDQPPLTSGGLLAAQRELAEAQHLFDNPDHWLDRAFAQPIDRFPDRALELVGHLHRRTGIIGWWHRQARKALVPTWMMRIAPGGNVGIDPTPLARLNVRFAKEPVVHRPGR